MAARVLVVAGEASGDLHAAAVARALRAKLPTAELFGMGGQHLRAAGVETLHDASEVAVMGLTEVVGKIPRILGVLNDLARAAASRRPAAALLVDLPDFNLRLARRLRRLGIPVIYYISPMVWAWRAGRTRQLARDCREVLCIYPFEEAFLRARGVNARFVGNPLLDAVAAAQPLADAPAGTLRLALLPGSRQQEIARLLSPMLAAAALLSAERPVSVAIPVPATLSVASVAQQVAEAKLPAAIQVQIVKERTADVLRWCEVALCKSGTATLEVCLSDRPLVVVYKMSAVTGAVARAMLQLSSVSLVNLLAGRAVVPELLQSGATPQAMRAAVLDVLGRREEISQAYAEIRAALGGAGAAQRVAETLLRVVEETATASSS